MARVKHLVLPKVVRSPVHTPQLEDAPPMRGDAVEHPEHGDGVLGWVEWRAADGSWVEPLQRQADEGGWVAIVTTTTGGFRCPLEALTRR